MNAFKDRLKARRERLRAEKVEISLRTYRYLVGLTAFFAAILVSVVIRASEEIALDLAATALAIATPSLAAATFLFGLRQRFAFNHATWRIAFRFAFAIGCLTGLIGICAILIVVSVWASVVFLAASVIWLYVVGGLIETAALSQSEYPKNLLSLAWVGLRVSIRETLKIIANSRSKSDRTRATD